MLKTPVSSLEPDLHRPGNPNDAECQRALAEALTNAGYPISAGTLAGMGHRGGGPEYELFGGKARYRWGSSLAWAKSRVRPGGRRIPDQQPQHAA